MLAQSLRVSRPAIARLTRTHPRPLCRTLVTPTAARQADLVQDLYLRELKAFKPTPVKPSDAEGHVQKFTAPTPPQSPEEGNLAQDLKAYEEQQVEVEGQASEGGETVKEHSWFEEDDLEESESAH
ncbi:MAG: hypothetical protein M1833_006417 [Piccolia ochrophora]|nr:MAG: hypothetical protein M1833_006417 [Piccolia ochrophora]